MFLPALQAASVSQSQATVIVNGATLETGAGSAVIRHGRVLVPMRSVFEKLGAKVKWYPTRAMVLVERGPLVTRLWLGSRKADVNHKTRWLDTAPLNINGVVRVPLRFISETYGAKVDWDRASRTVRITSS